MLATHQVPPDNGRLSKSSAPAYPTQRHRDNATAGACSKFLVITAALILSICSFNSAARAQTPGTPTNFTPLAVYEPSTSPTPYLGEQLVNISFTSADSHDTGFVIERSDPDDVVPQVIDTITTPASAGQVVTAQDNTVAFDTAYTYYVYATGVGGTMSGLATSATIYTAPITPDSLSVVGSDANDVILQWTDNSNTNEQTFVYRKGPSDSGYNYIATVPSYNLDYGPGNTYSYTDTGLTANGAYSYEVAADNSGGQSPNSAPVQATSSSTNVPPVPSNLQVYTTGTPQGTSLTLDFTAPLADETGFTVQRNSDFDQTWTTIATLPPATSPGATVTYTDTTVKTDYQYNYQVAAFNNNGASAYCPNNGVETRPAAPSNLQVIAPSNGSVTLQWTNNSIIATVVWISRTDPGDPTPIIVDTGGALAGATGTTQSYADTTVQQGVAYTYYVAVWNAYQLFSSNSNSVTVTPGAATVPAAPSNVVVTNSIGGAGVSDYDDTLSVSFTDNSTNEQGFVLERSTDQATWKNIATLPVETGTGTVVQYFDAGLALDTEYYYRVCSYNTAGDSAFVDSNGYATAPVAASNLRTTNTTTTEIDLAWQDNSHYETAYQIYRTNGTSDNFTLIASTGAVAGVGGTGTYQNKNLTPGTSYSYYVTATNAAGGTNFSNTLVASTLAVPPSAPSGLTASATQQTASLSWQNNGSTETGFTIQREAETASSFSTIATISSTAASGATVSTTDNTMAADTTYTYQVEATNSAGPSAPSNTATATSEPTAPSNFTATAPTLTTINLSWTDTSKHETGFYVFRKLTVGGTYANVATVAGVAGTGSTVTYTDSGLTPNTGYTYYVTAENAAGQSPSSGAVSATTLADTTPPTTTILTPANGAVHCGASVTLTYTGLDNVTPVGSLRYEVKVDSAAYAAFTTSTSQVISNLTDGSHTITVKAEDQAGNVDPTGSTVTFDADVNKPVISQILSSPVDISATITWTTDKASTSQVDYGSNSSYGSQSTLNSALTTSHSVTLSGLTPSTPYHFAVVSADNCQTATSTDQTFTTIAPLLPNLEVTSLNVPTPAKPGDTITVSWAVENVGQGSPKAVWTDNVYFSSSPALSSGATLLGTFGANNLLAPATSYSLSESITVPHVASGQYYIIVQTNANNAVTESNTTDNTLAMPLELLPVQMLIASPGASTLTLAVNEPQTIDLQLSNLSSTALTSIKSSISGASSNITVQFGPPTTLASMDSVDVPVTVTATSASTLSDTATINLTDAQGDIEASTLNLTVLPNTPALVSNPNPVNTGMVRGQQTVITINIKNTGAATAHGLTVAVPTAPWLALASLPSIGDLAPGATAQIVLDLTPPSTLALGAYTGSIQISGSDSSLTVPFNLDCISSATGTLKILSVDELYYFAATHPPLANVPFTLVNTLTGATVLTGQTDINGSYTSAAIPEGGYTLHAGIAQHESYSGEISITAGQVTNVTAFLSEDFVTYDWSVTPIDLQDDYDITIQALFQTSVPAPVVTVSPSLVNVADLSFDNNGQTVVNYTITNHGLIAANSVTFNFPTRTDYQFTPALTNLGTLNAESTMVIPVTVTKLGGATGTSGSGTGGTGGTGSGTSGSGPGQNVSPGSNPTITFPFENTTYVPGTSITVTGDPGVPANGATVTELDFYANGTLIGSATSAPYQVAFNNVPAGVYSLTLTRKDSAGGVVQSAPVTVYFWKPGITLGNLTAPPIPVVDPVDDDPDDEDDPDEPTPPEGPGGGSGAGAGGNAPPPAGPPPTSPPPAGPGTPGAPNGGGSGSGSGNGGGASCSFSGSVTYSEYCGGTQTRSTGTVVQTLDKCALAVGSGVTVYGGAGGGGGFFAFTPATGVGLYNYCNTNLTNLAKQLGTVGGETGIGAIPIIGPVYNGWMFGTTLGGCLSGQPCNPFSLINYGLGTIPGVGPYVGVGINLGLGLAGLTGAVGQVVRASAKGAVTGHTMVSAHSEPADSTIPPTGPVNAYVAYAQQEGQRLLAMYQPAVYLMGNQLWFQGAPSDGQLLLNFLNAFNADTLANSSTQGLLTQTQITALEAMPLPAQLTEANAAEFLTRWNRTVTYYGEGITVAANVPGGQSSDFIASDVLNTDLQAKHTAEQADSADGYSHVFDGVSAAYTNLENSISGPQAAGTCATVVVQLDQQVAITRSAFKASLTMNNASQNAALSNVQISLKFTDLSGNDETSLFAVSTPAVSGFGAVDGTGSLAAGASGMATWTIVPTRYAATYGATQYLVTGEINYTENGTSLSVPLYPTQITVEPDPYLHFRYFLQSQVYSNDPFTGQAEPAEPFPLGLLVINEGAGTANNLTITSSQPTILDNDKGLLVNFDLIGTEVNGSAVSPSFTVNLGDIGPQQTSTAEFIMTASLSGAFVGYDASYSEVNTLGNPETSLIDEVDIHSLNHVVRITTPYDDGKPDFLAMDVPNTANLPDHVYSSDGSVSLVTARTDATVTGTVSPSNLTVHVTVANPQQGYIYIQLTDPGQGNYQLAEVVRSDGEVIRLNDNAWLTNREIDLNGQSPYQQQNLYIFDYNSTGSYTVIYQANGPVSAPVGGIKTESNGTAVQFGDNGSGPGSGTVSGTGNSSGTIGAGTAIPVVATAVFSDGFYLENIDRSAGIKVIPENGVTVPTVGSIVEGLGAIRTDTDGERYIDATSVTVVGAGQISSLGITTKALYSGDFFYDPSAGTGQQGMAGGAGLNVIGLLVTTIGQVTTAESGGFTMTDGYSQTVTVALPSGVDVPAPGSYVAVTGVVSVLPAAAGLTPLIRVRTSADLITNLSGLNTTFNSPNPLFNVGQNLFSLPGIPYDPAPPAVLAGVGPADGSGLIGFLSRYDAPTQSEVFWDSNGVSGDFGNMLLGEGYRLQLSSGEAQSVTFSGLNDNLADMWISLPELGATRIGDPFNASVDWSTVQVDDGTRTLSLANAAAANELNPTAQYYNSATAQVQTLGLSGSGATATNLTPWNGYYVYSQENDLALFIPLQNGLPVLNSISPGVIQSGGPAFSIIASGSGFAADAALEWNGKPLTATATSSTRITATVPASLITTTGTASITVSNVSEGKTSTPALPFNILAGNPAPTTTGISPTEATASTSFVLTINGKGFTAGCTVSLSLNGVTSVVTPTTITSTQITATIPAADVTVVGEYLVAVLNPAPGGGVSNSQSLLVGKPTIVPLASGKGSRTATEILVPVVFENVGSGTAIQVQATTAKLGTASANSDTDLPLSVSMIAAGKTSVVVELHFPLSAMAASATSGLVVLTGSYKGVTSTQPVIYSGPVLVTLP